MTPIDGFPRWKSRPTKSVGEPSDATTRETVVMVLTPFYLICMKVAPEKRNPSKALFESQSIILPIKEIADTLDNYTWAHSLTRGVLAR